MSDGDQDLIPRNVRIKELCISIQQNYFCGGTEIFALHHSAFASLKHALVNCFSLQFEFTIGHLTSEIEECIKFITFFNTFFAQELCTKLLKIAIYTNGLSGQDVSEQLLSPFFALSDVLFVEFVELKFHFSNCSNLRLTLPTDALIKRLCFIDSHQTMNQLNKQFCHQFYFTVTLCFHTIPSNVNLKLNKIESDIQSASLRFKNNPLISYAQYCTRTL